MNMLFNVSVLDFYDTWNYRDLLGILERQSKPDGIRSGLGTKGISRY